MSFDVPYQIDACKRRMQTVRALVDEAKARGEPTTEEEQQILLEGELLRMLEALLAADRDRKPACTLESL